MLDAETQRRVLALEWELLYNTVAITEDKPAPLRPSDRWRRGKRVKPPSLGQG